MASVPRVRLTGRANRFLQMLVDLGHLDDEAVSQIVLSLQPPDAKRGTAVADIDTVRSAAAWVLADRAGDAALEGTLMEDWPLLFS